MPWELLYEPDELGFLATHDDTLFTRDVAHASKPSSVAVAPPLRLLLVSAAPVGYPDLDADAEAARIETALARLQQDGKLAVQQLTRATRARLRQAVVGASGSAHLLHVISHGRRGTSGSAELVLEDENGDPFGLPAADLALVLRRTEVRCVVLMACDTAAGEAQGDRLGGIGPALVREGIAAVITTQHEVPDKAAPEFSAAFYRALAEGLPVGAAVNWARHELRVAGGPEQCAWAVPVLHTRDPLGQLIAGGASGRAGVVEPPGGDGPARPEDPLARLRSLTR